MIFKNQELRIKKLAHCIDQESNDTATGNKEIKFTLNKDKYKKTKMAGFGFIITCLTAYYIFFFWALSLPKEDIVAAIAMLVMSLLLICIILVTIATHPVFGFYKGNKDIIDSLKTFCDES